MQQINSILNNPHSSQSVHDTIEIAKEFAKILRPGDTAIFIGDLGAGKTHFIKGICNYFEVEEEATSPTFTLINVYYGYYEQSTLEIAHIDLYRIENPNELHNIGFNDYLYDNTMIKLIEWPQRAEEAIAGNYQYLVEISIDDEDESKREIIIKTSK